MISADGMFGIKHRKFLYFIITTYLGHITKHVGIECKVILGDVEEALQKNIPN